MHELACLSVAALTGLTSALCAVHRRAGADALWWAWLARSKRSPQAPLAHVRLLCNPTDAAQAQAVQHNICILTAASGIARLMTDSPNCRASQHWHAQQRRW